MADDELYEEFAERYLEKGDAGIPPEWPEAVRKRCQILVRITDGASPRASGAAGDCNPALRVDLSSCEGLAPAAGEAEVAPGSTTLRVRERDRYVIERELARGGMGRILLAFDRDFRRRVAVKVLLSSTEDRLRAARFVEEAQATAQLEHPNIAPVYDLGSDEEGKPFFTMKWIRGRDLKSILEAPDRELSTIRLLLILAQAAMGVHFAHTRGVIHRDLKPRNVMVGDFGEVLVVDWGLAKVLHGPEQSGTAAIETDRGASGEETLEGSIQGSPGYMSPEQARGEVAALDARTDVFGLGAILYEILTGFPPHAATPGEPIRVALRRVARCEIPAPRQLRPDLEIPPALEEICLQALAADPAQRQATARDFHDALQAYIEGLHDAERRAREAARLQEIADRARQELHERELEVERLSAEEESLRTNLTSHQALESKANLWAIVRRHDLAREEAVAAFHGVTAAYGAVLSVDPGNEIARQALARLHLERLARAEERGDREAAALHEALVRQHHGGRFRLELEGKGRLQLQSDPPGALVSISRYEEERPFLVETAPLFFGNAPVDRQLERGSYVATLEAPGYEPVRYPFVLGRSGTHQALVELPLAGSTPPGFIHVPGGDSIVGGEARLLSALPRRRIRVAAFGVGRFPVTFDEYCEFLDEATRGSALDPGELRPRFDNEEYVVRDSSGRHRAHTRLGGKVPVLALSGAAEEAYCNWLGKRLGKRVRLLREEEWERCARGADGRLFPWGGEFDWCLAKGGLSRPGEPFPEGVGSFPTDVSPFGVRDLAGGVREPCAGHLAEGYRPCKGGSWYMTAPGAFRADSRTTAREGKRVTDVGLRVGYDVFPGSGDEGRRSPDTPT